MLLEDLAKWWKYFIHVCVYIWYIVKVIVDCSMAVTLIYIHIYVKSYMTWENQYKKNKASNYRWVRFMRKWDLLNKRVPVLVVKILLRAQNFISHDGFLFHLWTLRYTWACVLLSGLGFDEIRKLRALSTKFLTLCYEQEMAHFLNLH